MIFFGFLGITTPWLLLAFILLPVLWFVLRAVPPAAKRRRFPGVTLLLELRDYDTEPDNTPWWLLLLRTIIISCLIVGFSEPFLNFDSIDDKNADLLVIMDGSWADAPNWKSQKKEALRVVQQAKNSGQKVAFLQLTDPIESLVFSAASDAQRQIQAAEPNAWLPNINSAEILTNLDNFDTYWIASAVQWPRQSEFIEVLLDKGNVRVSQTSTALFGLLPISFTEQGIKVTGTRLKSKSTQQVPINIMGLDPSGVERLLQASVLNFEVGMLQASEAIKLPKEIRNRITRIMVVGQQSAVGVRVLGDNNSRSEVAIISGGFGAREGLKLLSQEHYLTKALELSNDLIDGTIEDILLANPDAIILTDIVKISARAAISEWIERGGTLIRFAGPNLAAANHDLQKTDDLMPVKLRRGGRSLGGAMSWGSPKTLQPFEEDTPFFGLPTPTEVKVTAQVLAQPSPMLSTHVIARLSDGTPLVTQKKLGQGRVVLFHITANTEWSNLPISGLFVSMLDRLVSNGAKASFEPVALAGTTWKLSQELSAFGKLKSAGDRAGIDGQSLIDKGITSKSPPGIYEKETLRWTINLLKDDSNFKPPNWPSLVDLVGPLISPLQSLTALFLLVALVLLAFDVLISLWMSGKLLGVGTIFAALLALLSLTPENTRAQTVSDRSIIATRDVVLAYVRTGDVRQDEISSAGLLGLSLALNQRTSIEPVTPLGVSLAVDELSFYPFLYWPITPAQKTPTADELQKLNRYLKGGGLILFDTKDADISKFGQSTIEAQTLKEITVGLNLPPLSLISRDHVLTRSFYLLQEFPGRYAGTEVWLEASSAKENTINKKPFRNSNDGVTPVIIGGNDWASAWAVDSSGQPLLPVGRGVSGERQREIALRFGINLIMHVLTGNYKSDQVHVPALLDRLGK